MAYLQTSTPHTAVTVETTAVTTMTETKTAHIDPDPPAPDTMLFLVFRDIHDVLIVRSILIR